MPPSVQRGRLKFGESCCALTSQRLSLHLGPRARYAVCPSRLWASASTAALGFTAAASVLAAALAPAALRWAAAAQAGSRCHPYRQGSR